MSGQDNQALLQSLQDFFGFLKEDAIFQIYQPGVTMPVAPTTSAPVPPPEQHLTLIERLLQQYQDLLAAADPNAKPALNQKKLEFLINRHLQVNYLKVQMLRLHEMLNKIALDAADKTAFQDNQAHLDAAFTQFCDQMSQIMDAETAKTDEIAKAAMAQLQQLEHYYRLAFNLARKYATDEANKKAWLAIFTTPPHGPVAPLGTLSLFSPASLKNVADSYAAKHIFKLLPRPTQASVFLGQDTQHYEMKVTFCPFASYQDTLTVDFVTADQGVTGYLQDVVPKNVSLEPEQFLLVAEKLFNAYLMMYMTAERSLLESTAQATGEDLQKLPVTLYMDLLEGQNPNEPPGFTQKRVAIAKAAYALFQQSRQDPQTGKHPLIALQFVNDPPMPLEPESLTLGDIIKPIQGQDYAAHIEKGSEALLKKHAKACQTYYKKLDTLKVSPARFRPTPS